MDTEELKEQLGESKKMLIALGVVLLFAVYMLWPSGDGEAQTEEEQNLEAQLEQLRQEGAQVQPKPVFSGTDNRGISVGGGGGGGDDTPRAGGDSSFQTGGPDIVGVLVGFGTKVSVSGEYLVAYVYDQDKVGYEVDMRQIFGYTTAIPSNWEEGEIIGVYGTFDPDNDKIIIAEAIQ